MDQRTQFLIQVLEKIGGPLTSAATILPVKGDDGSAQDAKRVAELLNRSVQLGLSVAEGMNVRDESQADGVHLSLAAFSSPLIAGQYMATGRVPGDLEIRRLSGALQAVLTFADSFTPAADSTLRLQNTDAGSSPADEALIHVQMLTAFAPVFQVVAGYAFGRQENKLIQEIATRLTARAETMRTQLFGDALPVKEAKQAELILLKVLCGLYAAAHANETQRLMTLPDNDRSASAISVDGVWALFDRSADMARVVAESIIPPLRADTGAGGSKAPAPQAVQPPVQAQVVPPVVPPAAVTPANQPPMDPTNPMAFFTAKKAADGSQE